MSPARKETRFSRSLRRTTSTPSGDRCRSTGGRRRRRRRRGARRARGPRRLPAGARADAWHQLTAPPQRDARRRGDKLPGRHYALAHARPTTARDRPGRSRPRVCPRPWRRRRPGLRLPPLRRHRHRRSRRRGHRPRLPPRAVRGLDPRRLPGGGSDAAATTAPADRLAAVGATSWLRLEFRTPGPLADHEGESRRARPGRTDSPGRPPRAPGSRSCGRGAAAPTRRRTTPTCSSAPRWR